MSTKTLKTLRRYQTVALALGVFCAGAIASNIMLRRAPAHDALIQADFTRITGAIDTYAINHAPRSQQPTSLSELSSLPGDTKRRLSNYGYKSLTPGQYQLCATFLTDAQNAVQPYANSNGSASIASHPKGYQCFTYRTNTPYPLPLLPKR